MDERSRDKNVKPVWPENSQWACFSGTKRGEQTRDNEPFRLWRGRSTACAMCWICFARWSCSASPWRHSEWRAGSGNRSTRCCSRLPSFEDTRARVPIEKITAVKFRHTQRASYSHQLITALDGSLRTSAGTCRHRPGVAVCRRLPLPTVPYFAMFQAPQNCSYC